MIIRLIRLSASAHKQYEELPQHVQKAADKQFSFLLKNIRHPSLHAKKHDESTDIWQARITRSWRFYFIIHADRYHIVSIRNHSK